MEKNRLLFIPFFIGLMIVAVSWAQSYPLSVTSVNQVIFDRVSILYWIGLPILLVSTFMMMVSFKSDSSKCLAAVCLVMFMYSLQYFYYATPGSDSHSFRGLTEYFIKTNDLNPALPHHLYFEYPSFFVLGKMAVDMGSMPLPSFEFILYAAMGFLMTIALYKYFSSKYKKGGFLAVATFFIPMFYFLNYQYAPFSLAFTLFLVSIMLEARLVQTKEKVIVAIVLFTGIVFTHAFVPLFFLLYELIMYVINRKSEQIRLLLLTTAIYFAFQITQASNTFAESIRTTLHAQSEYANIAEATLTQATNPIDQVAQTISRPVVIATVLVAILSFAYLLARRSGLLSRPVDRAILISGLLYSILGVFIQVLGSRVIPLVFIPVFLSLAYVYQSRFKVYFISIFAIVLVLFVFLPMHSSFYDFQTTYQTQEAYRAENFVVDNYNWTHPSFILAHTRVVTYLEARQPSSAYYDSDFSLLFPRFEAYDAVVYTIGLGKGLMRHNSTLEAALQKDHLNMVYDNGYSHMAMKSSNFTWAFTP